MHWRRNTVRIPRKEDNFMGVFKNIRHGAAVAVCIAAMSTGLATAAQASTAHAAKPAYPSRQNGTVYSCTGAHAPVETTDGGDIWYYTGSGPAGTPYQYGVVYSSTTNRTAWVQTYNGGESWYYETYHQYC
jgi:hypothetical protein